MDAKVRDAFLLLQLILAFVVTLAKTDDLKLVTRPLSVVEDLYFQVIEPEQISYLYKIRGAKDFGGRLNSSLRYVELVPALPEHGCSPISNANSIKNKIALLQRGGCSFVTKTIHAQEAGAIAVIITDNDVNNIDRMIDMIQDETKRDANIPAFFLLGKDGYIIKRTLQAMKMSSAVINIPVNVTGIPISKRHQPPWTLW